MKLVVLVIVCIEQSYINPQYLKFMYVCVCTTIYFNVKLSFTLMQMDNTSSDSFVNLDDEGDVEFEYDISSGDSGSGEHNDLGDKDEAEDVDAKDDHYKRILDLSADDIRHLDFGSEEEAYQFYQAYAKYQGFIVRKDDIGRDYHGNVNMRQFVCNRQGLRSKKHYNRTDRKRDHKPVTRTNCLAKLRVHLDYKIGKWKVVSFEECHNHELTPARFVHFIPPYRVMNDADKAKGDMLHSHGGRTGYIIGDMVQKGGYGGLGFSKKDLDNYIDQHKRVEIKDMDATVALSYLQGKADNDNMLFSKYTSTTDGKLEHLFWADGQSRVDYQCFCDVLAIDATYKNKYNRLLVIFSGCNHHSQAVIFGCALLLDEATEIYKWVLESFLEAMCFKHPKVVETVGDGAISEAIKHVFPNASHRLSAWNLLKSACDIVKNDPFLEDFKRAMYSIYTIDGFEDYWKNMVEKHGLIGNEWVSKTYENRSMWAHAYLRDELFGLVRTTSQCEAINSLINICVRQKGSLCDFIRNFDQIVREYRNNELTFDYKSLFSEHVMTTTLLKIEREASQSFTFEIFSEVKNEIEKCGALNVIVRMEDGDKLRFKMNKYGEPGREINVFYDRENSAFLCDCRLFQSRGIPCCHIFCAMRNEHVESIPSSLICKRWTMTAKSDFISSALSEEVDSDIAEEARYVALQAASNNVCRIASKSIYHFNEVRNEILRLANKFEKQGTPCGTPSSSVNDVCGPTLAKTKDTPSKKKYGLKKRCSHCNSSGHTIRTCPTLLGMHVQHTMNTAPSPSNTDGGKREVDPVSSYNYL